MTYVIYGFVKIRYCSAPARVPYKVGSGIGSPIVALSLADVSIEVVQGLLEAIEALWRISQA